MYTLIIKFNTSLQLTVIFNRVSVIEFVDKWPHQGHIITKECTDADDIPNKKSSLIGQINKVLNNLTVKLKLGSLKRIVLVSMEQNCGIYLEVISSPYSMVERYQAHMTASKYHTFCIYYQPWAILCRCSICFLYACWVLSIDVFVANLHWSIVWSVMGWTLL